MYASQQTARWFFETFYLPHRLAAASPHTLVQYRTALQMLDRFAAREVLLEELTEDLAASFVAHRLGQDPRPAVATVNKDLRALRAIARFASDRGQLPKPINYRPLKEPRRQLVCWDLAELTKILQASAEENGTIEGLAASSYWRALLLVAYDTGARINALMQTQRASVNLHRGSLTITAETQKQKADQVYLLSAQAMEALAAIWPPERRYLWPWPHRGDRGRWRILRKHYRRILRRAGLPTGRRDMFHKLRRTTATFLAAEVGLQAAQQHLGHSSPTVTRAYIDVAKLPPMQLVPRLPRPT